MIIFDASKATSRLKSMTFEICLQHFVNLDQLLLGILSCWPDRDTIKGSMPATFREQFSAQELQ